MFACQINLLFYCVIFGVFYFAIFSRYAVITGENPFNRYDKHLCNFIGFENIGLRLPFFFLLCVHVFVRSAKRVVAIFYYTFSNSRSFPFFMIFSFYAIEIRNVVEKKITIESRKWIKNVNTQSFQIPNCLKTIQNIKKQSISVFTDEILCLRFIFILPFLSFWLRWMVPTINWQHHKCLACVNIQESGRERENVWRFLGVFHINKLTNDNNQINTTFIHKFDISVSFSL